jgi:hypothetical protein
MTDRVRYGITSAILAPIVVIAVCYSADFRDPCGAGDGLLILAMLLFPVVIGLAALTAGIGYALGSGLKRDALVFEAVALAVALVFVGASQMIPGFNPPSNQQCRIDF